MRNILILKHLEIPSSIVGMSKIDMYIHCLSKWKKRCVEKIEMQLWPIVWTWNRLETNVQQKQLWGTLAFMKIIFLEPFLLILPFTCISQSVPAFPSFRIFSLPLIIQVLTTWNLGPVSIFHSVTLVYL